MEEEKIVHILKKHRAGLSITELVKISGLSRSIIRTTLAKLEGANKVSIRNVGMAKLHYHKRG